ncbi:MAG: non-homologous end-joining DNA ligase [Candidatus Dormiibacterota bacterium]
MSTKVQVAVGGRQLSISNLDKVFYPQVAFTKAQVIDYYTNVAPAILPHLKGRALTLKRYPDGVEGPFFYEKNCPKHRPEWVHTAPIWSGRKDETMDYCVIDDLPSLIWAANLASIELHTSLSLAKNPEQPTMMVFDLDPGPPATIKQCCVVGMMLKEMFDHLGLEAFPKTSGSKGLQVYVPLNTRSTYDATKSFSLAMAQQLESEHRDLVISQMKRSLREGKVFVDWSQNDRHKTTICVYSLRARELPTVSTPVTWDEVKAHRDGKLKELAFTVDKVIKRVQRDGDLFAPVLKLKQKLPKLT